MKHILLLPILFISISIAAYAHCGGCGAGPHKGDAKPKMEKSCCKGKSETKAMACCDRGSKQCAKSGSKCGKKGKSCCQIDSGDGKKAKCCWSACGGKKACCCCKCEDRSKCGTAEGSCAQKYKECDREGREGKCCCCKCDKGRMNGECGEAKCGKKGKSRCDASGKAKSEAAEDAPADLPKPLMPCCAK